MASVLILISATAFSALAMAQQLPGLGGISKRPKTGSELVSTRAVVLAESLKPGAEIEIGVIFEIDPEWHIYWQNPGEAGVATSIDATSSASVKFGDIRWPRPTVLPGEFEASYVYEKQTVLFLPLTLPNDFDGSPLNVDLHVQWLVCKTACLKGESKLKVTIAGDTKPTEADTTLISTYRKRLPRHVDRDAQCRIEVKGNLLSITGPAALSTRAEVISADTPGVVLGDAKVKFVSDRFEAAIPFSIEEENALGHPLRAAGLVMLGTSPDDPSFWFDVPAVTTRPH